MVSRGNEFHSNLGQREVGEARREPLRIGRRHAGAAQVEVDDLDRLGDNALVRVGALREERDRDNVVGLQMHVHVVAANVPLSGLGEGGWECQGAGAMRIS